MRRSSTRSTGEKAPLAPDTAELEERAARAWTEPMAVTPIDDGQYVVEGASGTAHVVDPDNGTCTCPDHALGGHRCKHLRRVALELSRGSLPPPTGRTAPCVVCGTEAPAGRFAPVCGGCAVGPGDLAVDRETEERVFVVGVTDDRADETLIEAAEITVADYPTNGRYDPAARVVTAVYCEAAQDPVPRRYAFPMPRLRPIDTTPVSDRGRRASHQ